MREPGLAPKFMRGTSQQGSARYHCAAPFEVYGSPMMNAMVCHITEGKLRLEQERKTFTGKKNFVWTCNKETKVY